MPLPDKPHHIVFGAGLIGGTIAGGLLNAGLCTSLVARAKTQAAMANCVTLTDYLGNRTNLATPNFIEPSATPKATAAFLWLTVKCTAVQSVLEEVAQLVTDDTIIICCQNGFGSDMLVRERFPRNTILGAVIGYNVTEPKAGHLHRSTEGRLVIEYEQRIAALIARLNSDLFPCALSDNFVADRWAKLQLNLANPVNALADIPVRAMLKQRGYRQIISALQSELLTVTHRLGLELPKLTALPASWLPTMLKLPDFAFKLISQKMLSIDPTARASMWWDLRNNKPTEIDFLNRVVVTTANELGLRAPLNEQIVALVHNVENGQLSMGLSATQLWLALSSA